MNFFGLGIPELSLILILILLFFGKDRLPELARSIGHSFKELRAGFTSMSEDKPEDKSKEKVDAGKKQQK